MQLRKLTEQDFDSDMPLPFLDDPEPVVKEILTTELTEWDDETAERKRRIITRTDGFLTETGSDFYIVKQRLANHKNGTFQKFVEECGYNTRTVERLIYRYNYIVTNGHNIEYLESLPTRVLAAAGAPNADPELKEKVAAGEITTIKELQAWKEEKRKLEKAIEDEREARRKLTNDLNGMITRNADLQKNIHQEAKEHAKQLLPGMMKEELKKQQEALQEALRKQEAMVARLEDELTILRPLKRREEEIQQKLKELDEAREEVHRAKARNTLFDAVAKARKSFNDAIYPVVTVAMAPEIYGDTLKKELMDLVEMTENFTFALKQKFNL